MNAFHIFRTHVDFSREAHIEDLTTLLNIFFVRNALLEIQYLLIMTT